ncbi:F0F1 ATP synthase subunit delta [soil metagenome]
MALGGSAARRYAEAILDLAVGDDAVAEYRSSLERLRDGLSAASLRALRDPSVPLRQRVDAARAAAAGEPAPPGALLQLTVSRNRIGLLPDVVRAFGELVDRREGIAKAKITTAVELDEERRRALLQRLESASGSRLRATFAVDPSLIGGATVQVGDHLIDSSIRAQLQSLRSQLAS